jgi:ribulose bisphosphate carboxylase small subunit
MIVETYLLEILSPDTEKWLDCGFKSKFKDLNEAVEELKATLQSYPGTYKFRINHITCAEETVLEMSGKQNILGE